MEKRKYTLRKRAEQQQDTRQRIVEATMALHEELGPRGTSISAVAERAGVQRLTVYRYFPDETALFQACTSGWLERHPLPGLPGPAPTVRALAPALRALYAYYEATAGMWAASYRDVDAVPALHEPMRAVDDYLRRYADALASAWPACAGDAALAAAARLAVQFSTWQTLAAAGLDTSAMAALMARLLAAAPR
ncbi:MAG: TetR/AcrR family transcriptional regulator [Piscinibacter sp.]|nr:TetR/AcrR family transcriptional regulator [Piscinibacter sp.]